MYVLDRDLLAFKELSKLKIDGKIYLRIIHHLGNLITNITVFEFTKNLKSRELTLTEVFIDDVPNYIKEKILSDDYKVDVTSDDKSLALEALQTKFLIAKRYVEDCLNVGYKRKLMQFIEVGGHYFAFVFEAGMPYTKIYHTYLDFVKNELYVGDVPKEMLPALFEALSPLILKGTSDLIIQIGEGVYTRISMLDKERILATVVVATEEDDGESKLKLLSGFTLLKLAKDKWVATVVPNNEINEIQEEMKKSFEFVYQDLLLKLFEVNPEETLKGL